MTSETPTEIDAEKVNEMLRSNEGRYIFGDSEKHSVPAQRDDDEFDIIIQGLNRAESQTVMRLLRQHGSDRPGDLTIRPSRPLTTYRDGPFYDPASGERVDPTETELGR